MSVLVTGSAGFLGKKLCETLAATGVKVRALVRDGKQRKAFLHPGIHPVIGDIMDLDSLRRAMEGCSEVYHLAAIASDWAPSRSLFYKVNFQGTLNVLEIAKEMGVGKIVATSTMGTIGPPDPTDVREVGEDHVRWVDFFTEYASSKILTEERIQHLVRQGQHIVITNPTRIFGPGVYDRKNGLVIVMDHYLHRPFAVVPGRKEIVGNYVYLDDVVEGHILAMKNGRPGEKYILGGYNLTFGQFLKAVGEATGRNGRRVGVPFAVLKAMALAGKFQASVLKKQPFVTFEYLKKIKYDWPVSSQKAISQLGYSPTKLEDAILETVEWLKERRKK